MSQPFSIAIDGPSGAGKSTIAQRVARQLNILYLDTGAMYRAVGLFALNHGIRPESAADVIAHLQNINLEVIYQDSSQHVILNGYDVSQQIRENQVSAAASAVSALPEVREKLVALQREIAQNQSLVMDGRDIGTHVLPHATLKIFLTASLEERAKRRHLELEQKGQIVDYDTVLEQIAQRDHNDSSRAASPLKQADDAILLDTTGLSIDQVVLKIVKLVRVQLGEASE